MGSGQDAPRLPDPCRLVEPGHQSCVVSPALELPRAPVEEPVCVSGRIVSYVGRRQLLAFQTLSHHFQTLSHHFQAVLWVVKR